MKNKKFGYLFGLDLVLIAILIVKLKLNINPIVLFISFALPLPLFKKIMAKKRSTLSNKELLDFDNKHLLIVKWVSISLFLVLISIYYVKFIV